MHVSPTQRRTHRSAQRRPEPGYRESPTPSAVTSASIPGALQVPLPESGLRKKLADAPGQTLRDVSARRAAQCGAGTEHEGSRAAWAPQMLSREGWGCGATYEPACSRRRQPRPRLRRPAAPPPAFYLPPFSLAGSCSA